MIPFLKWNKIYLSISMALIVLSIYSIFVLGFRYSVEFVGGTDIRYQLEKEVSEEQIQNVLAKQELENVDIMVDGRTVEIRTAVIPDRKEQEVRQALRAALDTPVTRLSSDTVGPSLSRDNLIKTAVATGIAIIGILIYVAYAFKNLNFAIGAVVALFHDVFILIGSYAFASYFFGAELDTLFVTAALTTMSFSVHDTIVMFDQMRMYMRKFGTQDVRALANRAITDTMMRSVNNSVTIVFMLLALMLLGGDTIRYFAFALLVGTIIGTYSSPFVSIPVAVWLEQRRKKKQK
jgi:preprotein translocase subunit SecF